jgi:hypothetical protein
MLAAKNFAASKRSMGGSIRYHSRSEMEDPTYVAFRVPYLRGDG